MMEKQIWIEKICKKNFNQQISMYIEGPNLDLIFKSPNLDHFLLNWYFFPLTCMLKNFLDGQLFIWTLLIDHIGPTQHWLLTFFLL
jgi:hypothetical protein